MENASKALLIAGSILIVILLIGLGVLMYSRSTGIVDTVSARMNSQEIEAFNSQFTPYEGNQKGASVRTLISKVISSNATYKDASRIVNIDGVSDADALANKSREINTGKTYTITFKEFYSNGLIKKIQIAE